jgi:transcription antitermination factor NusG
MTGVTVIDEPSFARCDGQSHASNTREAWYALWTHSHCEQLVHDQLAHQGLTAFLPKIDVWSRRRGERRRIQVPMFPGYLFLRHVMDKAAYVQVMNVRGLARVLGARCDRLEEIPDEEIESVRRVVEAHGAALPHAYLKEGQRVRITRGPLEGLEGILTRDRSRTGLFVISVHLLRRSVAVIIDCTDVVPA